MIEKKEIEIAKETEEVLVLIVRLIETIRGGNDYALLLPELIAAINGADGIPEELRNRKIFINTIGGKLGDIVDAFVKDDVE